MDVVGRKGGTTGGGSRAGGYQLSVKNKVASVLKQEFPEVYSTVLEIQNVLTILHPADEDGLEQELGLMVAGSAGNLSQPAALAQINNLGGPSTTKPAKRSRQVEQSVFYRQILEQRAVASVQSFRDINLALSKTTTEEKIVAQAAASVTDFSAKVLQLQALLETATLQSIGEQQDGQGGADNSGLSADAGAQPSVVEQSTLMTTKFRAFIAEIKAHEAVQRAIQASGSSSYDYEKYLGTLITHSISNVQLCRWELVDEVLKLTTQWLTDSDGSGTDGVEQAGGDSTSTDSNPAEPNAARQNEILQQNGVKFAASVLDSHAPYDVYLNALQLSIALLDGGNRAVQNGFQEYFESSDDVVFFRNMHRIFNRVLHRLKEFKLIKQRLFNELETMETLRIGDKTFIYTINQAMELLIKCQRFLQLLCEGHNSWMQEYLREQADNSESIPIIQTCCDLVCKMVGHGVGGAGNNNPGTTTSSGTSGKKKATTSANVEIYLMDVLTAQNLQQSLDFLVELSQGPCSANQEQILFHGGLVETLDRILNSRFTFLDVVSKEEKEGQDFYYDGSAGKFATSSKKKKRNTTNINEEDDAEGASTMQLVAAITKSDLFTCSILPEIQDTVDSPLPEAEIVLMLKQSAATLLNALLEIRTDAVSVRILAIRLDPITVKKRIFFHYVKFLQENCDYDGNLLEDLLQVSMASSASSVASSSSSSTSTQEELLDLVKWKVEKCKKAYWELSFSSDDDLRTSIGEALDLVILLRNMDLIANTYIGIGSHREPMTEHFLAAVAPTGTSTTSSDNEVIPGATGTAITSSTAIDLLYDTAYDFFFSLTAGVEVCLSNADNKISRLFFVKPLACKYALQSTKRELLTSVPVTNPQTKLQFLCDFGKRVLRECQATQSLSTLKVDIPLPVMSLPADFLHFHPLHFFFRNEQKNLQFLIWLSLMIALVINLVLICTLNRTRGYSNAPVTYQFHLPGVIVDNFFSLLFPKSFVRAEPRLSEKEEAYAENTGFFGSLFFGSGAEHHYHHYSAFESEPFEVTLFPDKIVRDLGFLSLLIAGMRLSIRAMLYFPIAFDEETEKWCEETNSGVASASSRRKQNSMTAGISYGKFFHSIFQILSAIILAILVGNNLVGSHAITFAFLAIFLALLANYWELSEKKKSGTFATNSPKIFVKSLITITKQEPLLRALVLFILSILALTTNDPQRGLHYYAFMLFDVFFTHEVMRNLFRAVLNPMKQLMFTGLMMAIVLYAFALTAYSPLGFGTEYLAFSISSPDADGAMGFGTATTSSGSAAATTASASSIGGKGTLPQVAGGKGSSAVLAAPPATSNAVATVNNEYTHSSAAAARQLMGTAGTTGGGSSSSMTSSSGSESSSNWASNAPEMLSWFFVTTYDIMVPGPTLPISNADEFHNRFAFDVLFYVIIEVVLMNIIFGIIIDTFGALRDETNSRQDHLQNYCFICNISHGEIEHRLREIRAMKEAKATSSSVDSGITSNKQNNKRSSSSTTQTQTFEEHIKHEHNLWDYLFFLFYVLSKDPTTFTGPEQTVYKMLSTDDLSFFPVEKALCLQKDQQLSAQGGEQTAEEGGGAEGK
ncbi:unnamed protein product [Amoebophrya sp. A120]|nr:unnamed protein product [Amoebophrya sp. A120]|eukprot:GSA120T00024266001.1